MQFLKTLFWMVFAVSIAIFATRNWRDVTIDLWGPLAGRHQAARADGADGPPRLAPDLADRAQPTVAGAGASWPCSSGLPRAASAADPSAVAPPSEPSA